MSRGFPFKELDAIQEIKEMDKQEQQVIYEMWENSNGHGVITKNKCIKRREKFDVMNHAHFIFAKS